MFLRSALLLPLLGVLLTSPAQDQWPLKLTVQDRTITLYQPQPESYSEGRFTARAAVAVLQQGKDPVYGAVWMSGFLEVDRDTRMGTLTRVEVTDAKFPAVTDTMRIKALKSFLAEELPKQAKPISIDRLIASLENGHGEKPAFKHDPPAIFYEESASTLVLIDGEPILQPLEKSNYERVVNTPFLMAATKDHKTWYLGSSEIWYTAGVAMGPWTATADVPADLKALVKKEETDEPVNTSEVDGKKIIPKVVVSTKPAELLQTRGPADLQPIQGTQLLYVTNTDNDIFMDITSQRFYALLSGRWFASAKLGPGGWGYIDAEKLPTDFAKIPEGHPSDGVLASVPGTDASREAVLDASIPQTAKVDRKATTTITYDGEPKWRLIEGTTIYEAENSSAPVLYIREHYYACDNAVWYDAAQANGPWKVCDKVPEEVKDIPPSSPNYNVKYVKVYDSTSDVVYVGYTPGYTGCYVYGPTVVYGTGYYYQPWYGTVYYPPPVTWGFNMHYNPWTGWSMGLTVSNGWMTVSFGGYPGGWWGPPMYRPPYYPPPYYGRGGGYHGGNNNINIGNEINVGGGDRGQGDRGQAGQRPSQQPSRGNLYDKGKNPGVQPSRPTAGTQPAGGTRPSGGAKPGVSNNMYTDRQGNVYRNDKGNWQQQGANGKFQNAPSASQQQARGGNASTGMAPDTRQQLQRDQMNRDRGQQRVNNYQSRPSYGGGGSYGGGARGAGGGMRGGGGGGMRGGGGRR